jgi:prefoldin beta subunit
MSNEEDHKVNQLGLLEQNMQNTNIQKQNFHLQLLEIESALKEMEDSPEVYKIVANIMVRGNKDTLRKELTEKKEMVELRIKTLEKQESKLREKASELQKEVLRLMR